jgi:hypothetical protein
MSGAGFWYYFSFLMRDSLLGIPLTIIEVRLRSVKKISPSSTEDKREFGANASSFSITTLAEMLGSRLTNLAI